MNKKGFTLIELLLVVSILGIMFAVSLPVTLSMYYKYKAALRAEEVLLLVSTIRREAFLYAEERTIAVDKGKMIIDDAIIGKFGDVFVQMNSPVKFFRTGTTSGGEIKLYMKQYSFVIYIQPLFGELRLKPL